MRVLLLMRGTPSYGNTDIITLRNLYLKNKENN